MHVFAKWKEGQLCNLHELTQKDFSILKWVELEVIYLKPKWNAYDRDAEQYRNESIENSEYETASANNPKELVQ